LANQFEMERKSETILIVGGWFFLNSPTGGYSAISFAEEYRKLEKENLSRIIIYSAEEFCSRPNLFFRLKV
jgi:hypothetical protein